MYSSGYGGLVPPSLFSFFSSPLFSSFSFFPCILFPLAFPLPHPSFPTTPYPAFQRLQFALVYVHTLHTSAFLHVVGIFVCRVPALLCVAAVGISTLMLLQKGKKNRGDLLYVFFYTATCVLCCLHICAHTHKHSFTLNVDQDFYYQS